MTWREGSGGDRLALYDFTSKREALATAGTASERLIRTVRAARALADSVPHVGFPDGIADTNDHSAPLESLSTAIATDYQ